MEQWLLKKRNIDFRNIQKEFNLGSALSEILSRRPFKTIEEVKRYLFLSREDEHSPSLMKDMIESTEYVVNKIKSKEKMLLSLDYDVDGIISGAIAYNGLKKLGADVECIFPHRISDGYGINKKIVDYAKNNNIDTIITYDNGIAAFEAIDYANELGIDIVVTDHHEVPQIVEDGEEKDNLVNAKFIVNPKQRLCNYPFKNICGAMIAYKFLSSINNYLGYDESNIQEEYELLSIATICDVMDLVDENRIVVKKSLESLSNTSNVGLKMLFELLGIDYVSTYDIGFRIGPCFNSSGRLETASIAYELLVEKDKEKCMQIAEKLVGLNEIRKSMTTVALQNVIDIVEENELYKNNIIIVNAPDIHESLAGIVAGRIKEKYNLPSIIFTESEGYIKGSARSIENVDIYQILSQFKDYFYKFGGHKMAAGLSLEKEKFDNFVDCITSYMNSVSIDIDKKIYVDSIINIDCLSVDFTKSLKIFEPFGKENPEILFSSLDLAIVFYELSQKNSNFIKITFSDGKSKRVFTSFDSGDIFEKISKKIGFDIEKSSFDNKILNYKFDIIYKVSVNEFKGREYLNLNIVSIR